MYNDPIIVSPKDGPLSVAFCRYKCVVCYNSLLWWDQGPNAERKRTAKPQKQIENSSFISSISSNLSGSLSQFLVSYHLVGKGKLFCHVASDLLWTMIMTERSRLWTEVRASPGLILLGLRSHRRNCWGTTHRIDGLRESIVTETSRSSGLNDSGLFFHKRPLLLSIRTKES